MSGYRKTPKNSIMKNGFYKRNNGSNALIEVVGKHESGDILCRWAFDNDEPFRYHPYEFGKEFKSVTKEYIDSIERQLCPDHASQPLMFKGSIINKDSKPDRWDKDEHGIRSCSFCGSIHPDDLIELFKKNGFGIIERSDKSYKWYIHIKEGRYKYYRSHDSQHDFVNKYNAILEELKSKG